MNNEVQNIINIAQNLKENGKFNEAIYCYKDAFDLLSKKAKEYAQNSNGGIVKIGILNVITSVYNEKELEYLKKDKIAFNILKNISDLYNALGDKENANKFLDKSENYKIDKKNN